MSQAGTDEQEPNGIAGWLLLPLLHLAANPSIIAWSLWHSYPAVLAATPGHKAGHAVAHILGSPPWLFVMFAVYCLLRFVQRRREVPKLMTIFYGLSLAWLIVLWGGYAGGYAFAVTSLGARTMAFYPLNFIVQIALLGVWIAYFNTSERVKNTFTSTAPTAVSVPVGAGIGGWLIVVLVLLASWCIVMFGGFAVGVSTLPQPLMWSVQHGTAFVYRFAIGTALIAYSLYCLVRFLQRRRQTRSLVIALAAIAIVFCGLTEVLVHGATIRGAVIVAAIWAAIGAYFWKSQRVKNTFVR